MKNTKQDDYAGFIFKRKEAYALSVVIVIVALLFEVYILVADSSGGSTGKLLAAIPVAVVLIIRLILKNSEQSK